MLGIDAAVHRDRMEESLEVVLALMRSDEPVTRKSEWFTLRDARLQLRPFTDPHPEDAIALIEELIEQSNGGFGTILLQAHEWADTAATNKSYELFARHVLPHFDRRTASTDASKQWLMANRGEQMGAAMTAIGAATQQHASDDDRAESKP